MIQSWVLDLIVKDGIMDPNQQATNAGVWLIISADGISRPFSTTESLDYQNPSWNYPARLILQYIDVKRSYLYVTLCTHGKTDNSVQCIGRSRIGLRYLPVGSPKTLSFPLMEPHNAVQEVMKIRITATLSSIST